MIDSYLSSDIMKYQQINNNNKQVLYADCKKTCISRRIEKLCLEKYYAMCRSRFECWKGKQSGRTHDKEVIGELVGVKRDRDNIVTNIF